VLATTIGTIAFDTREVDDHGCRAAIKKRRANLSTSVGDFTLLPRGQLMYAASVS
jgi:hypothetical protein